MNDTVSTDDKPANFSFVGILFVGGPPLCRGHGGVEYKGRDIFFIRGGDRAVYLLRSSELYNRGDSGLGGPRIILIFSRWRGAILVSEPRTKRAPWGTTGEGT